jgi:hypothetical protein
MVGALQTLFSEAERIFNALENGFFIAEKTFALRSASERTNSTLKEDNGILRKPPVRSLRRAAVVSQMGVITTLLDRVMRFVIDNTIAERKYNATGEKKWFDKLSPPKIPAHLQPFVVVS